MNRLFTLLTMEALAMASMSNPYYMDARRIQGDLTNKSQEEGYRDLINRKGHTKMSKFSIHGVIIEAKSRKDAIKKYKHLKIKK